MAFNEGQSFSKISSISRMLLPRVGWSHLFFLWEVNVALGRIIKNGEWTNSTKFRILLIPVVFSVLLTEPPL